VRAMRTALRAALAATLILSAAGCGSDSREGYRRDVNDVGKALRTAFAQVAQVTATSADPARVEAELEDAAGDLDAAATDLAGIEPPGEAASAHAKIVAGVREYARAIRGAAAKAKAGGVTAVSAQLRKIAGGPGARQIQQAIAELKQAGYEFHE
jgi:hypothetical protein